MESFNTCCLYIKSLFDSHHVVLPLLLLHNRDLTNRGHTHHHRLDAEQIREKEEEEGESGGGGANKENDSGGKSYREACRSQQAPRQPRYQQQAVRDVEKHANDMQTQSGFIYLLLDVTMGNRNRTRRPVEEVLIGGNLTRLHWSSRSTQLLHKQNEQKQEGVSTHRYMVLFNTVSHL